MIEEFLRYLTLESGYSPLTVSAYRLDLSQWADYATGGRPEELVVTDVTTSDLKTWIAEEAEKVSSRSLRRKISSLRSFFKFLLKQGVITVNPATRLKMPKLPHPLPVNIRPEETEKILETPAHQLPFAERRNRLIFDLLYSTGMRCSELIGLTDAAVNTTSGELKVVGKRNKERVIPFGPQLARDIDDYRSLRDSSPETAISPRDPSAPLLVLDNGKPLYRKMVYNVVHRMMIEGGAHASRLSPHVLRHSMATDMLNSGAPLSSVQQLLGHASLTSTQVYTHVTFRDLQHNYQLAHPRAQTKKGGQYGH
ncbi:MAG: tyrosine-type recombinase/integrase [Bacteroidales bacterium]|nr:tyrosine-type recombinase/integrase [Bacteroidales bacterium]